jgi:hypothetical protein
MQTTSIVPQRKRERRAAYVCMSVLLRVTVPINGGDPSSWSPIALEAHSNVHSPKFRGRLDVRK